MKRERGGGEGERGRRGERERERERGKERENQRNKQVNQRQTKGLRYAGATHVHHTTAKIAMVAKSVTTKMASK